MESLIYLLLVYTAVLGLNVIVMLVLWRSTRSEHYRNMMVAWLGAMLILLANAATSGASHFVQVVAFGLGFGHYAVMGYVMANMLRMKFPWKLFIGILACALIASYLLDRGGASPYLTMGLITFSVALPPIFSGVTAAARLWKGMSWALKGFAVTLVLHGLHVLDYTYAFNKTYLIAPGFTVGLVFMIAFTLFGPAAILEEISNEKARLEVELSFKERLERLHRQLMETSRQAGRAEMASSVLHNVGNVLNSLNISGNLILKRAAALSIVGVGNASDLAERDPARTGSPEFVAYLRQLHRHLTEEKEGLVSEARALAKAIDHAKVIVRVQQGSAKVVGVIERVDIGEVLREMTLLNRASMDNREIHLSQEVQGQCFLETDRHRLLQILSNLLSNARYAVEGMAVEERRIVMTASSLPQGGVRIQMVDTGTGISPEDMEKLFTFGFTTNPGGHGFGLHNSALIAKELGGKLTASSEGRGRGAAFTLVLPAQSPNQSSSGIPAH